MTVVVTGLAVETEAGSVLIRRSADRVYVTWFCGEERSFTKEDLRAAVNAAERIKPHEDVWLKAKDSNGMSFALSFRDGSMTANSHPSPLGESVPWDELRKALRRVLE